jgi:hypothetical protein
MNRYAAASTSTQQQFLDAMRQGQGPGSAGPGCNSQGQDQARVTCQVMVRSGQARARARARLWTVIGHARPGQASQTGARPAAGPGPGQGQGQSRRQPGELVRNVIGACHGVTTQTYPGVRIKSDGITARRSRQETRYCQACAIPGHAGKYPGLLIAARL